MGSIPRHEAAADLASLQNETPVNIDDARSVTVRLRSVKPADTATATSCRYIVRNGIDLVWQIALERRRDHSNRRVEASARSLRNDEIDVA